MAVNSSFIVEEWISVGKKWVDVPPKVRRAATQAFTVPAYIHQQLLPSPDISIHKFIDFPLPKLTVVVQTILTAEYFSCYEPEPLTAKLLERMHCLSMQTSTVTKELVTIGHQAWLDGFKSVKYVHIGDGVTTRFPLWLISFWSKVHHLQTTVCDPWVKVKAWLATELHQKKALQRCTYAEDVNILLAQLPWGMKKCGVSDTEPIHTMWRYLEPHFTSGSQKNDLLEILCSLIPFWLNNSGLKELL